jgi:hypothetical protein
MLDSVRLETKCDLATEFKRARETQKSAPVVPGEAPRQISVGVFSAETDTCLQHEVLLQHQR